MPRKQRVWNFDVSLHPAQLEVFLDEHKFRVLVNGRRWGKSHLQVNDIAVSALAFPSLMPGYDIKSHTMETVILAGMPTLKQARKILWKPLVKVFEQCPLVKAIDRTNNVIKFAGNHPEIHVAGLNDNEGDRARGMKLWRANLDEIQDIKPSVLDTVIFPAMSDTPRSRGLFTGTPKGRANHLFGLFHRYKDPKLSADWASFNFPTWTNPFIPQAEIDRARATLAPRLFQQEYEASFVNFIGQCFSEFDEEVHVVEEARLPTRWDGFWLGIDPGDINPAVVLVGLSENRYYVLSAWKGGDGANPVPIQTVYRHCDQLCEKFGGKVYRTFVDPSRPGVIFDLRQRFHKGLQRAVAGYNRIEEGVQLMNNLFHQDRLFVAKSVGRAFIDELISYHWKTDENDQALNKIEEGQDDHRTDALRYVLASLHNRGGRGLTE